MGIIVDLIIIGIIVLSTYLAYKKGLVALAIKLCAGIIAIVATLILYRPISMFIINTTNIDETIQNAIIEKSYEVMNDKTEQKDLANTVIEQTAGNMVKQNAKDLSEKAINICVILVLYFGIKIALIFVKALADKVADLPILNKFNKAGGLVFGLIRGLVIVYVSLLIIVFVGKVNPQNAVYKTVEESYITKIMAENNVFNILL